VLSLTKKTGYGLVALVHLAEAPGRLTCAREIALRFGVPSALLMNVMKDLAGAGYIESVRGAHGGYRLARRPDEMNLAQIIDDLEGPIRMSECLRGRVPAGQACDAVDYCTVADPVHRVQRKLRDFLRKITLADIMLPSAGADGDLPAAAENAARPR
jgi:Rrf2 family protein